MLLLVLFVTPSSVKFPQLDSEPKPLCEGRLVITDLLLRFQPLANQHHRQQRRSNRVQCHWYRQRCHHAVFPQLCEAKLGRQDRPFLGRVRVLVFHLDVLQAPRSERQNIW